jgi:hypothetical protein
VIGLGAFPEILTPPGAIVTPTHTDHDHVTSDPHIQSPAPTARGEHAARVRDQLDTCERALEDATDAAYHAIRDHAGVTNDDGMVRALSETTGFLSSPATLYGLKSGTYWRKPSPELCTALDEYGMAIGAQWGLTAALNDYIEAKQADDDMRNSRR